MFELLIIVFLYLLFTSDKKDDDEKPNDKTYKPFFCGKCCGSGRKTCDSCGGRPDLKPDRKCYACSNSGFVACNHW